MFKGELCSFTGLWWTIWLHSPCLLLVFFQQGWRLVRPPPETDSFWFYLIPNSRQNSLVKAWQVTSNFKGSIGNSLAKKKKAKHAHVYFAVVSCSFSKHGALQLFIAGGSPRLELSKSSTCFVTAICSSGVITHSDFSDCSLLEVKSHVMFLHSVFQLTLFLQSGRL